MFRNYDKSINESKKDFYNIQRTNLTYNKSKELLNKYCNFTKTENFWNLFFLLDDLIDISDPDTSFPNSHHAIQTAEAIRRDNHPDWMILIGLIHDMGKILYINNDIKNGLSKESQWAIVGDTYLTDMKIPDTIVYPQFNINNEDHIKNLYNNYGEYKYEKVGLDNYVMSFGHDEYMYRLLIANNSSISTEGLYMIRYHSCYLWHTNNEYLEIESEKDREMKPYVKLFNKYDLYSKDDTHR